jgi:hypothetical protein
MGPPLWSSGQSSWLHIQRSGFDSRRYKILIYVLEKMWKEVITSYVKGLQVCLQVLRKNTRSLSQDSLSSD